MADHPVVSSSCLVPPAWADVGSPRTRYVAENGATLDVLDGAGCKSPACGTKSRELTAEVGLLRRQMDAIHLRGIGGHLERGAVWKALTAAGVTPSERKGVTSIAALERFVTEEADPRLSSVVLDAKKQLLAWVQPQGPVPVSLREANKALRAFAGLRDQGNASAHPYFDGVSSHRLMQLAKRTLPDASVAWPCIAALKRMSADAAAAPTAEERKELEVISDGILNSVVLPAEVTAAEKEEFERRNPDIRGLP